MTNGLGLGGAYDATIGRIKAQEGDKARLGMATLMWISHSERPLNVDEICHALAVDGGSTGIDTKNVPSIQTVLACCQGLVTVDVWSWTIRLIHFTLKEYLSGRAELFHRAHSTMAETCLTYLNFQTIKDLPTNASRDLRDTPLLEYSSLYWGTHMRMELSDHSRYLALLDQYENHISAELLWWSVNKQLFTAYIGSVKPFSVLHCISYFGIAQVAIDLIKTKRWDVNQRDTAGLTPLMWAARYGREEVVKLLLGQKHTQPDLLDTKYSRTALPWAASSGHEGVVRLFLGPSFVNPGRIGRRWRRMLQVMGVLFGRKYINPDKPDNGGQTPLWWASKNGHEEVVKLLLRRRDVSPDRPGNYGQAPLSWAARRGYDGIAKLLLEREEVSPDRLDNYGQTPLSLAAWNGHDGVIKLLLGRVDVNLDRPDSDGQTPLLWAACNGHGGVVEPLLGRAGASPSRPDNRGRTPLSRAARNGHDGVVKLLLGREDVNPDKPDSNGQTPPSLAPGNRHHGVVKLLLERGDVNPNRPGHRGQTPLQWAPLSGYDGIVKLLLEREDVIPDRQGNGGEMPLSLAAYAGCD